MPQPHLKPSESEQPQGVTLRDAAKRIDAMFDKNADINPKGTKSRLAADAARDGTGRFVGNAKPADDADDTADAVDSDVDERDEVEADDAPDDADRAQDVDDDEDETGKAAEQESDAPPIQSLAELAEALDIPLADLKKQLKHKFNAAGGEVEATLDDLERSYQMEADYQRNKTKLSEERRVFETASRQAAEKFVADSHVLAQQYNVAEQLLIAEMQHPRVQALRATDPAEWGALYAENQQKMAQLQQARNNAAAHYQAVQTAQQHELRTRGMQQLSELVPDWNEDKRVISRKAMLSLGYDENEVSQVFDARLIRGALELHNLRAENAALKAEKATALEAAKRIKKEIPRMMKPGKSTQTGNAGGLKRENVGKLRQRLRKSGSVRDAGSVIENMGIL